MSFIIFTFDRKNFRTKHILSFLEKAEKEKCIFFIFIKKIRIEADRSGEDLSKNAGESVK